MGKGLKVSGNSLLNIKILAENYLDKCYDFFHNSHGLGLAGLIRKLQFGIFGRFGKPWVNGRQYHQRQQGGCKEASDYNRCQRTLYVQGREIGFGNAG